MNAPRDIEAILTEVLDKEPAERFEIVAALLRDKRPQWNRLGWSLAKRTVDEHDFLAIKEPRP